MPDLTTLYQWHCATAENWTTIVTGSTGTSYTVRWGKSGHHNRSEVQYDYSCDCKGYKFGGGKHCTHIEQAKATGAHCNWMQFSDGGDAVKKNNKHHCPNCNEQVHSMGWGV